MFMHAGEKCPFQNVISFEFKIQRHTSIKWFHGVFPAILSQNLTCMVDYNMNITFPTPEVT